MGNPHTQRGEIPFEPDWRHTPRMRLYSAWLAFYFHILPRRARRPVAWLWRTIEDRGLDGR